MVDIQKKEVDNLGRLNLPNTMKEATLYEWLGNILHCEFFITDSFHGVCFALIFNKPFLCINNPMRGSGRFHSLLNLLRLQDRMLPEDAEALPENVPLTMDYAPVNELLEQKISQSREWLQQAFSGERDATLAEYSRLTEKKLTRRPPSRWERLRKKGRKLLARRTTASADHDARTVPYLPPFINFNPLPTQYPAHAAEKLPSHGNP